MPELVERGHIFISQPPLFKVKKGRSESYIKDERDMAEYLMQKAVDAVKVRVGSKKDALEGKDLRKFLDKLMEINNIFNRTNRHFQDPRVVDVLLGAKVYGSNYLGSKAEMKALAKAIAKLGYTVELAVDEEHSLQKVLFQRGSSIVREIGHAQVSSPEYQRLVHLHQASSDWDQPPFTVETEKATMQFDDRQSLLDQIMVSGKKDLHIQRYKGLGEMNPDQLWKTTMDPAKRRLLQVQINDAVGADEIFSVLMGDAVDPRRQFIQGNALDVKNLDV